jgi:hypothetical protein
MAVDAQVCEGSCGTEAFNIYTAGRVVDEDYMFQGGDGFGLEFRRVQIRDEGFEEGHVVSSWFKREVGFRADDKVGGFEVGKGGYDLACVECWI